MRRVKTDILTGLLLATAMLVCSVPAGAEEADAPDVTMTIALKDGSSLVGRIVQDDGKELLIVTTGGMEVRVPKDLVASVKELRGAVVDGQLRGADPNYTRLMFSPNGRPLRKGDGYFSDFYVLFPSVSYGVTNNLSVSAGMSVIPGLGLTEQVFYVAPRVAVEVSENFALSGGVLYATGGDDDDRTSAGIAFGVATLGRPDKSLTAGLGFGFTRDGGDLEWQDTPVLMLGGNARLSNHLALVSENWLILDDDFSLSEQPFGVALRFFGERLSADVGVLLVGEVLEEGLPIPWLSFSYHFGKR